MTKISEQWGEQRKKAALIVPKVYATMGEREIEKKYGIHRYYISQTLRTETFPGDHQSFKTERRNNGTTGMEGREDTCSFWTTAGYKYQICKTPL